MVYGTAFSPLAMKDAVKGLGVAGIGDSIGVLYLEYIMFVSMQTPRRWMKGRDRSFSR